MKKFSDFDTFLRSEEKRLESKKNSTNYIKTDQPDNKIPQRSQRSSRYRVNELMEQFKLENGHKKVRITDFAMLQQLEKFLEKNHKNKMKQNEEKLESYEYERLRNIEMEQGFCADSDLKRLSLSMRRKKIKLKTLERKESSKPKNSDSVQTHELKAIIPRNQLFSINPIHSYWRSKSAFSKNYNLDEKTTKQKSYNIINDTLTYDNQKIIDEQKNVEKIKDRTLSAIIDCNEELKYSHKPKILINLKREQTVIGLYECADRLLNEM